MQRRMPALKGMHKDRTGRLAFELLEIMDGCSKIPGKVRRLKKCLGSKDRLTLLKVTSDLRGELDPHLKDHIRNARRLLDGLWGAVYDTMKKDGMTDDDIGVALSKRSDRRKRSQRK